ncbi:TRAP transporter substrate-binding protein [Chloroflexota bacterium]
MRKVLLILAPLLVLALILGVVGCGGEEATPTPKPTVAPTKTPTPTKAPTPAPTPTPTPEPIVLKLSHKYPIDSVAGQNCRILADLMEEYTNGQVTIDIYPAASLFSTSEEVEAVYTGAIDMSMTSPYYYAGSNPACWLWWTEGIFESADHAGAVVNDGRVMRLLAAPIEEAGTKILGINLFGIWAGYPTKNTPVDNLMDLKDLKCGQRSGQPPTVIDLYVGYELVPMPREELYTGYATGIVDIVPNALANIIAEGYDELSNYCYFTPTSWSPCFWTMNPDTWDSLPADIQDIIMNKVIPEATEDSFANCLEQDELLWVVARDSMTVKIATPEEMAALVAEISTYDAYIQRLADIGPEILAVIDELRPSKQ